MHHVFEEKLCILRTFPSCSFFVSLVLEHLLSFPNAGPVACRLSCSFSCSRFDMRVPFPGGSAVKSILEHDRKNWVRHRRHDRRFLFSPGAHRGPAFEHGIPAAHRAADRQSRKGIQRVGSSPAFKALMAASLCFFFFCHCGQNFRQKFSSEVLPQDLLTDSRSITRVPSAADATASAIEAGCLPAAISCFVQSASASRTSRASRSSSVNFLGFLAIPKADRN